MSTLNYLFQEIYIYDQLMTYISNIHIPISQTLFRIWHNVLVFMILEFPF